MSLSYAKRKAVSIHIDGLYAFHICHAVIGGGEGAELETTKFSNGSRRQLACLLGAIQLPLSVALMHCPGHSNWKHIWSKGKSLSGSNSSSYSTALSYCAKCPASEPPWRLTLNRFIQTYQWERAREVGTGRSHTSQYNLVYARR